MKSLSDQASLPTLTSTRAPLRRIISMHGWVTAHAAGLLLAGLTSAHAETWTWDQPDSGVWTVPVNWDKDAGFPNAAGDVARFLSNQTTNRTVTLGQNITIGTLSIDNASTLTNSFNAASSTFQLIFNVDGVAGPGVASISVTGPSNAGNNPNNIFGPVVLNDDITISVDNLTASPFGALTFRSAGSNISGPGSITKLGLGQMNFADSPKTFTGALTVNEGSLRLNASGRVTGTSGVTVASGARIVLDGSNTSTEAAPSDYTFGSGASTVVTLQGSGFAAFPGALRLEGGRHYLINNQISIPSPGAAINLGVTAGAGGTLRLPNVVSGAGRLTMGAQPGDASGQPRLILSADNTYTGGTTSTYGTIVASGGAADLGEGDVTIDGKSTLVQGATTFTANGRLTIQTGVLDAINDTATLTLTGSDLAGAGNDVGGFVTLETGVNETIGGLVLGETLQAFGTYGSTASPATFKNDEYFSGPGIVTVVPEPGAAVSLLGGFGALVGLRRLRRLS